jgi:ABC-type glycerol-3-phosphate transport system substrate-binding protein
MRFLKILALGAAMAASGAAQAQTLTVWHDLGDNGVKWFAELNELYKKTNPGVTIASVSYPTDQWFGRVIAAINTGSPPDLIYNNYERVIRIQNQTSKVMDLKAEFQTIADRGFLSDDDLRVATFKDRMIILPIQRVQMALGARKSWLDKVGEPFPKTWADTLRVATKFQKEDPDGNGRQDTFGFALQAANPRDLIHMLDLFMVGTGLRNTVIDPAGKIVIDEPRRAEVLKEFLKVFAEYKLVAPDTINHSFGDMYKLIEGGRAGFFRVGDWNVRKWDAEAIKGDFVSGPWPAFRAGDKNAVVIGGMRGIAVPENAPNKAASVAFAKFMLTKEAQSASLTNVGAAVRGDFPITDLSERRMYFAQQKDALAAYDFPESVHPAYPEIEAAYHKALLLAIASPPSDWDAFIKKTAADLQKLADSKKQ